MECALVLLLFALLLSAAGPCAAASPAPLRVMCDAYTLATQLTSNCSGVVNPPNGICCEAAITAVDMPDCFCAIINQQPFQESNMTGEDVVSIYTICRDSTPLFDPKECSGFPPVVPSPPTLIGPAAPVPPPPTPTVVPCPMVPSPTPRFSWLTKLRDGFLMAACTIGGWLFLIGLARLCRMIRPHLPSWFPGALMDALIDGLSDTAQSRLDLLHPSLKREILRLADWAKEHGTEDSTPALVIQVTQLVQDIRLYLGEGDPEDAITSTPTPSSVADLLMEIIRLGEILRQEKPVRDRVSA